MSKNNTWMIMTYYCPTHGSLDRSEPVQFTRNDLRNVKIKFNKNKKLIDQPKIPEFLRNVFPKFPTRKNKDKLIKSIIKSANNL